MIFVQPFAVYVFHDLGAIGPISPKMQAKFKCPLLKMVYLIGPNGLVNRRFSNFHKVVWMTTDAYNSHPCCFFFKFPFHTGYAEYIRFCHKEHLNNSLIAILPYQISVLILTSDLSFPGHFQTQPDVNVHPRHRCPYIAGPLLILPSFCLLSLGRLCRLFLSTL